MIVRLLLPALLSLCASAQTAGSPAPVAPRPAPRPAVGRAGAAASYKDLKFAPMRLIEPAQPVRFQLANGMKVLLLEDHETPLVTAVAMIRTGSIFEPPERAGLASIAGSMIRGGGAGRRTPDRLDADLDGIGATLESNIGEAQGTVTLSALREGLAEALSIFRDVLTEPAFRQDKLDFFKAGMGQTILRRNDDPRELLRREFRSVVFGRDSAAGRRPEYSTVTPISRADLTAFYKRYFFPSNVILTVSGDFDTAQLKGTIETLFGSWNAQQPPVSGFPKNEVKLAAGAYIAVKPDLRETYFAVGQLGGTFDDPDAPALEVAAAVLGGGPESRLIRRARETRALLREIRAEWLSSFGRPGLFVVSGFGVSTATGELVHMIVDEIQRLNSAEITEDELRVARDLVLMKYLTGLDSKPRALAAAANLEYYGYPPESLQQFQKAVTAVTRADVVRVAKGRLDPQEMTAMAVSNLSVFSKPLDPRGGEAAVTIDLSIPPPAAGVSTATAAAGELGKRLLARVQQAVGGADKLAAVKDYSQTATYVGEDGARETQTDRWLAPSHLRQDLQSSRVGMLVRYTDGQGGWLSNGRASTALTREALRQSREEILRAYVPMLLSDRLPDRAVAALDEQTVEISSGALTARLVFDPQTGLPSRLLYEFLTERQPVLFVEEEYSDFRDMAGIKVPFAILVRRNGLKHSTGKVSEFKVNGGTTVELLQRRP